MASHLSHVHGNKCLWMHIRFTFFSNTFTKRRNSTDLFCDAILSISLMLKNISRFLPCEKRATVGTRLASRTDRRQIYRKRLETEWFEIKNPEILKQFEKKDFGDNLNNLLEFYSETLQIQIDFQPIFKQIPGKLSGCQSQIMCNR